MEITYPSKVKISNEAYHAHEALGSTNLKHLLRSPAHYLWEKTHPTKPTPAMEFGTIVHEAILEPELFKVNYCIRPEFSGKGSVAQREEWESRQHAMGRKGLDAEDYEKIQAMLLSVSKHKTARRLLDCGHAEESYFAEFYTDSAFPLKCRPDLLREGKIIVDVKTTSDASLGDFQKSIANFKYHLSAALYLDVVSAVTHENYTDFVILAIETKPPYAVATFLLDEATIDVGRSLYKKAMIIFAQSKKTGIYEAYPDEIQPINLPAWAWPTVF
jgi:hypothetical protein